MRIVAHSQSSIRLAGIPRVRIAPLDLADPASVDAFAAGFAGPLHILINSAGIMRVPLSRDRRGYEAHFATNHLGHYQLSVRLWPALQRAEGARVVAVSAWAHRLSPVHLDDPMFDHRPYDPWAGYAQSKTANILYAVDLDRRGRSDGIRAFSLHPGAIITTDLSPNSTHQERLAMGLVTAGGEQVVDPERGAKTAAQGASTSVWCATSPSLAGLGGLYCENNDVSPVVPPGEDPAVAFRGRWPVGVAPHAIDPLVAERLWDLSAALLR